MAAPLLDRQLLFVTGKGGVGKTTVAGALALSLARAGKRVMLLEIGGVPALGPLFGIGPYGYEPVKLAERLWLSHITPSECLREYGLIKLRIKALYDIVFENPFVRALLSLLPGMEELLLIGKIDYLINQKGKAPDGKALDVVVVDAPPTGQGMGLVSMPRTILSAVSTGPIAKEVHRIEELLTNPNRTGLVLTTTPEELPVDELFELHKQLSDRRLPVAAVVANKRIPVSFSPDEVDVLKTCVASARANQAFSWAYHVLSTGLVVHEMESFQSDQIRRLKSRIRQPIVELPLLVSAQLGPQDLDKLEARLRGCLSEEIA